MTLPPPPPLFWLLLALCALGFALLYAVVRDAGRGARRRALRQRIDAIHPPSLPADPLAVDRLQAAQDRAQQALRRVPPPGSSNAGTAPVVPAPWFLFLGDAAAGVPDLLDASPLAPDASAEENTFGRPWWRWWTSGAMAAIEIDPCVFEDPATAPRARGLWLQSLLALAERRERFPLNGIVACIGARALREAPADPAAFLAHTARLRQLVEEAGRTLRLQLPIYLVVTGLEQLDGYPALRGALPPEVLAQAMGHRLQETAGADAVPAGKRLDALFNPLAGRLHALRMALLREQPGASGRLAVHSFVEAVCGLQPGLRLAAETLFDGENHGRKARDARGPRWRGLYFTAAAGPSGGSGAFANELFERFLPTDQPLVRPGRAPDADRAAPA